MQGKEKRKFRRLAVYHLVKYRFLSDASKVDFRLATLRDIGAGGVCLRTREPVAVSTPIELKINFPSLDTPVSTLTKVIWAKQRSKSGYYEIGAQFSELEEAIRKNIDARIKFVYNKLKQKKRGLFKIVFGKGGER